MHCESCAEMMCGLSVRVSRGTLSTGRRPFLTSQEPDIFQAGKERHKSPGRDGIPSTLLQGKVSLQFHADRRTAHQNRKLTWLGLPRALAGIIVRKSALIEGHRYAFCFTGFEEDFRETLEFLHGAWHGGMGIPYIKLHDFGTLAQPGVFHTKGDGDRNAGVRR